MRETTAGVNWVDVTVEPHHMQQFGNTAVRVYEATIAPGTATAYHRHTRDTLYVITSGGRFRSDEPGHQRTATKLGRSTPLRRQLWWLLTRALTGGWVDMPAGTLIAQPHRALPLVHRVVAHSTNAAPIRMIGVERQSNERPAPLLPSVGMKVEYGGPCGFAYRIHLPPGGHMSLRPLSCGGVLIVIGGTATVTRPSEGQTESVCAGRPYWLAEQTQLHAGRDQPFHAVVVTA